MFCELFELSKNISSCLASETCLAASFQLLQNDVAPAYATQKQQQKTMGVFPFPRRLYFKMYTTHFTVNSPYDKLSISGFYITPNHHCFIAITKAAASG
jgi:hypothetical protein